MRALCIGINYSRSRSSLSGCHRDALEMERYLRYVYGTESEIHVLLDDRSGRYDYPNQVTVRHELEWLTKATDGDVWVSFSGHGSQRSDENGDEPDHQDESLYLVDGTFFADDDFRTMFVDRMSPRCTLFYVGDHCHSGSFVDLPFGTSAAATPNRGRETPCPVWSLTACRDDQTALDDVRGGVMTRAFRAALDIDERPPLLISPIQLVDSMNLAITFRVKQITQLGWGQRSQNPEKPLLLRVRRAWWRRWLARLQCL